MAPTISERNKKVNKEIFPQEIIWDDRGLVQCAMPRRAKRKKPLDVPEIFLGGWLKFFGIKVTHAGVIAGCSQGQISNMSGGRKPSANGLFLYRISEFLGVTVNDFYKPAPFDLTASQLRQYSPAAQESIVRHLRRKELAS